MYTFNCADLTLDIDEKGYFCSITANGEEILSCPAPVVSIGKNGQISLPAGAGMKDGTLCLRFEDGGRAELRLREDGVCVSMELTSVSDCDAALFGPYEVNIGDSVGETVGVVRGRKTAFGIQALNIKTLPGLPQEYGAAMDFDRGITVSGCSNAAVPTQSGAKLCFYCRRRDRKEYRRVMDVQRSLTLPLPCGDPDALIEGAALAFFGAKREDALDRIGGIELKEGLPHPLFEGEWNKTSRKTMKSYLITGFGAGDADLLAGKAEIAGIDRVYHEGPFLNWGHFELDPAFFPQGDGDLRSFTGQMHDKGIKVGVHTLSNFTTTNDPYVTPLPSEHLLKMGKLELTEDIDDSETSLTVKESGLFAQTLTLNAMQAGDELITFSQAAHEDGIVKLTGCVRGAFGTAAAAHTASEPLWLLWDYPYKTLFPDMELQDRFCDRLTEFFNDTGIDQISFDGLEGCCYTGHDEYAPVRFVDRCEKGWNQKRGAGGPRFDSVISDASNLHHYSWHYHSYMNWGEPWGEAMRTAQTDGRIKNQAYFERNLFPRMFGWTLIRLADRRFEATTPEEFEWMLSMAAGFDCGYAISVSMKTLRDHGMIDTILGSVRLWDRLRLHGAFPSDLRERLRDVNTEWHLEEKDGGGLLYPLDITRPMVCDLAEQQPGQPGGSDWVVEHRYSGRFGLRLNVQGEGEIRDIQIRTAGGTIKFPCTVGDGQYLIFGQQGYGCKAAVTDKNFNTVSKVEPVGEAVFVGGSDSVSFSCDHDRDDTPLITVRFFTEGEPIFIEDKPTLQG